jgi:hypothetical protein
VYGASASPWCEVATDVVDLLDEPGRPVVNRERGGVRETAGGGVDVVVGEMGHAEGMTGETMLVGTTNSKVDRAATIPSSLVAEDFVMRADRCLLGLCGDNVTYVHPVFVSSCPPETGVVVRSGRWPFALLAAADSRLTVWLRYSVRAS